MGHLPYCCVSPPCPRMPTTSIAEGDWHRPQRLWGEGTPGVPWESVSGRQGKEVGHPQTNG